MQGKVYGFNTGDLLDILGFVGDVGSGLLYFIAYAMDAGGGNIQRAIADYGTKYIVVAGLLNIICRSGRPPDRDREETMTFELSHFTAAVIFAACASTVFGITQRNTSARHGALRRLLLRPVCRRSDSGVVGDVADQTLKDSGQWFVDSG